MASFKKRICDARGYWQTCTGSQGLQWILCRAQTPTSKATLWSRKWWPVPLVPALIEHYLNLEVCGHIRQHREILSYKQTKQKGGRTCVCCVLSLLCSRATSYCSHRKFLEALSPITAEQTIHTQHFKALHCLSALASLDRSFNLS